MSSKLNETIGLLIQRNEHTGEELRHELFPDEALAVGRADECNVVVKDRAVSRRQLKITASEYDSAERTMVDPLVSVENLSQHGTKIRTAEGTTVVFNTRRLLQDGDVIALGGTITLTFQQVKKAGLTRKVADGIDCLRGREQRYFKADYTITTPIRLLGGGAQAEVLLAEDSFSSEQVACKIIDHKGQGLVEHSRASRKESALREVDILKQLSHPNILSLRNAYHTNSTVYIFTELLQGGDLYAYICRQEAGRLSELQTLSTAYQILKGLEHIHRSGFAHCDLKPENVLFVSVDPGARLVIADFGMAKVIDRSEGLTQNFRSRRDHPGTCGYQGPELARGLYMPSSQLLGTERPELDFQHLDMWALGVITATCLSGRAYFAMEDVSQASVGRYTESTGLSLRYLKLEMETAPGWKVVSPGARTFVRGLLSLNHHDRPTATEALSSIWFINRTIQVSIHEWYQSLLSSWQPGSKRVKMVKEMPDADESPSAPKQPSLLAFSRDFHTEGGRREAPDGTAGTTLDQVGATDFALQDLGPEQFSSIRRT